MSPPADAAGVVDATEDWFIDHGLPWFVDDRRDRAASALRVTPVVGLLLVAGLVGAGVGSVVGFWRGDATLGMFTGLVTGGVVLVAYSFSVLSGWSIVRWAVRRTLASLGLVFPLITRALPLLLLFLTFLFINTEVWQVASSMDKPLLWVTVLLFAALAVAFLLARLPDEVDAVEHDVRDQRLADCCTGTPMAEVASGLGDVTGIDAVRGLQRANLLLVLLLAQAVQVLLLSTAVFAFFAVFGRLAITPEVVDAWLGHEPRYVGDVKLVSTELFHVALFLAGFAGLYFTVYAVTDRTYREQFFTHISHDLERAVGVRTAYLAVRRLGDGRPAGPEG
ncbi:MAG: hypothetical protein GEU93_01770 [Propionibacteriales bacterium]|nr:hypothetical protein [Propionibacteriales bacterium]